MLQFIRARWLCLFPVKWLVVWFFFLATLLSASDFYWTNNGTANFTNSVNWFTNAGAANAFPGISDNANFTNSSTATINWTVTVTNANAFFNPMNGVVTQAVGSSTWIVTNNYIVGQNAGQTGTVVHTTGTLIVTNGNGNGTLTIGQNGVGTYILQGGTLQVDQLYATNNAASSTNSNFNFAFGTLTTGKGSTINNSTNSFSVGNTGNQTATWNINGGTNQITAGGGTFIGNAVNSEGIVTVSGGNTVWTNSGQLFVGAPKGLISTFNNQLTVSNGAKVYNTTGVVGDSFANNNTAIVTGTNSLWFNSGSLTVGNGTSAFSNQLFILAGAVVQSANGVMDNNSSNNVVTVSGVGSTWTNSGTLVIGSGGNHSSLIISNGGSVYDSTGTISLNTSSGANKVLVTDAGSTWSNTSTLVVGSFGDTSQLIVSNSASAVAAGVNLGVKSGSLGNNILITGPGSILRNSGTFNVGSNATTLGSGAVLIQNQGTYEGNTIINGFNSSGNITNSGGIFQFTSAAPTITTNTLNSIILTNGTISYRSVSSANIFNSQVSNITFQGNNTFQLNASTNAIFNSYAFSNNNGQLYQNLTLVNGNTMWQATNTTIGVSGVFTVSNTTAAVFGTLTNLGTHTVFDSTATYLSPSIVGGTFTSTVSTNYFNTNLTVAGGTVTLDAGSLLVMTNASGAAVGVLEMSGGGSIAGAGSLLFSASSGSSMLTNSSGSNTISVAVVLATNLNVSTANGTTLNVSGAVSGSKSLTKSGSGTLALSDVNTYSGGTTVAGGTLQISADNNLGNTAGGLTFSANSTLQTTAAVSLVAARGVTINNGVTAQWDSQGFNSTLAGVITGSGTTVFNKLGTAALTLSGNSAATFLGNTTVSAGTLAVTGNLGGSAVTVNSGSLLEGTGTVGTLVNHGTVQPGDASTIGTMTIIGNFTNASDGTLAIKVGGPASIDRLVIGGSAILGGNLQLSMTGGYTPVSGDIITNMITATGGVSGTFTNVNPIAISPTLNWNILYHANDVGLSVQATVTRNYVNPALGLNGSQLQLGQALQAFSQIQNGDLNDVLNAIDKLGSAEGVQQAYNEILPLKFTVLGPMAMQNMNVQIANLKTHFFDVPGLKPGVVSVGESQFGRKPILLAYNDSDLTGMFGTIDGTPILRKNWNFFITGNGTLIDQETTPAAPGFTSTAEGTLLGIDYWLTDNITVGFATGYSHTEADLAGSGGHVNAEVLPAWLFGRWQEAGFYINAAGGCMRDMYRNERNIRFPGIQRTAKSHPDGSQVAALLEGGHDFKIGRFTVGPVASLQYDKLWIDQFSETGADSLDLDVASQQVESLQSGLGGRMTYEWNVFGVEMKPWFEASWQREWADDSRSIEAHLAQGSSPFSVQTDAPSRNFASLNAGFQIELTPDIHMNIGSMTDVGRSNFSTYSLSSTLNLTF